MKGAFLLVVAAATLAQGVAAITPYRGSSLAAQRLNARAHGRTRGFGPLSTLSSAATQLAAASTPTYNYTAYNFTVPISHYPNDPYYGPHDNGTFSLRYWFDARHYKPGGPLFLLMSGETDAEGRFRFLDHGIIDILARATNGLGVLLEHRYYGQSYPFDSSTTDNLRFLSTDQSLADTAKFMREVEFEGLDVDGGKGKEDRKWIVYGGSYAGTQSALMKVVWGNVTFGAIASSGVPQAIWNYWQYFEPIRLSTIAPRGCIRALEDTIAYIDSILLPTSSRHRHPSLNSTQLKALFGLGDLTHDDDFGNALTLPVGSWQERNWDPEQGTTTFFDMCAALTNGTDGSSRGRKGGESLRRRAQRAFRRKPKEDLVPLVVRNLGSWFKDTFIPSVCDPSEPAADCFDSYNATRLADTSNDDGRSWAYQYATEYGFLQTGAPRKRGRRTLASRTVTTEYFERQLRDGFPKGEVNAIPDKPRVERVNRYGGYEVAADRLALIDGQDDPWRYAGPHSPNARHGGKRKDTTLRPFKLIPHGVHHEDEGGVRPGSNVTVPERIKKIQQEEVDFVEAWLKE